MHKIRANDLWIDLHLIPNGPLLIKSGLDSAADPTLPQMNFVRTMHPKGGQTVYLPGSSLKGVIRSHSERIVRTMVGDTTSICCDPTGRNPCSSRIRSKDSATIYQKSCLACRIFGSTAVSSHFFIDDAYPEQAMTQLATRQNVSIDRRNGAVANGPFDMEVLTSGQFTTKIHMVNFELWHLGLLFLTLRDIDSGLVRIGFAKSRGLGAVHLQQSGMTLRYSGQFGENGRDFNDNIYGVGSLLDKKVAGQYGYDIEDSQQVKSPLNSQENWGQVSVELSGETLTAAQDAAVNAWATFINKKEASS